MTVRSRSSGCDREAFLKHAHGESNRNILPDVEFSGGARASLSSFSSFEPSFSSRRSRESWFRWLPPRQLTHLTLLFSSLLYSTVRTLHLNLATNSRKDGRYSPRPPGRPLRHPRRRHGAPPCHPHREHCRDCESRIPAEQKKIDERKREGGRATATAGDCKVAGDRRQEAGDRRKGWPASGTMKDATRIGFAWLKGEATHKRQCPAVCWRAGREVSGIGWSMKCSRASYGAAHMAAALLSGSAAARYHGGVVYSNEDP